MKIALVEFNPAGGLYQFALQLGEALAQVGHQVDLITGRSPELAPRVPGVRVLPVLPTWHPAQGSQRPRLIRKAQRVVRAARYQEAWRRVDRYIAHERPDVVQFAEWRFALDGWWATAIARRHPGPVLGDLAHTPRTLQEQRRDGELRKASPALHRALAAAYARLDVVFVLGESSRTDFLEAFPCSRRVEVIPHGDEGIYQDGELPSAEGTAESVLFFGTLARYKGLEVLVEAFELVRRQRPAARLVVAGAQADVDVTALRTAAARIGNIDLRIGYVPVADVSSLFETARLVVAPYLVANQSGVIHLAQGFARPVVASDVGDLGDAVQHGETGLLVPPGDPAALSEAILAVLADPSRAAVMGCAGHDRLEREASWADVAGKVIASYEALLAARGKLGADSDGSAPVSTAS